MSKANKRRIRLTAVLLALALAVSGCTEKTPEQPAEPAPVPESRPAAEVRQTISVLRVPVYSGETLNPYTCTTKINQSLSPLMFESLLRLSPDGSMENGLAEEVSSETGQVWNIRLKEGLVFSDGSPVTAKDVLDSLKAARKSDYYSGGLRLIGRAVQGKTERELEITLSEPNQWFPRSLTFPVVKSGTEEQELPTGSGRYLCRSGHLIQNPRSRHPRGTVRTIELVPVRYAKEMNSFFLEGKIDLLYSQNPLDLNIGRGTSYRVVPENNLIYLSVNSWKTKMNTADRVYLASLIDKEELSKVILKSQPADLPFRVPDTEAPARPPRQEQPARTLPELTILVPSESRDKQKVAQAVAEQLRRKGCQVTVESCPLETLKKRISLGNYDLYIGELRIAQNMDAEAVLFTDKKFGPGTSEVPGLRSAWQSFLTGEGSAEQLQNVLQSTCPVIPLLFRNGFVCFSRDFCVNIVATEQDIFYNIGEWQEQAPGHNSGDAGSGTASDS